METLFKPVIEERQDQELKSQSVNLLTAAEKTSRRIKASLALRGVTQKALSTQYQINASDLSRVIKGDRKTTKIRRIIAQELGMEYAELWSEKANSKE